MTTTTNTTPAGTNGFITRCPGCGADDCPGCTDSPNENRLITCIPFEGFYDTWSDEKIDDMLGTSEYWYEAWDEDNPQRKEETKTNGFATWKVPGETDEEYRDRRETHFDQIRDTADYNTARDEYAAEYVKRFAEDNGIKLEYESLNSPREYNFTTDRIFAYITPEEVKRLYDLVDQNKLNDLIKEKFTSRSGFASFYEPDQTTWGPVLEWDHNQIETIIEAATIEHIEEQDARYPYTAGLMEDFCN